MKKVLVVLLALAVAGGSAFAQGWTFNGMINSGIGLFSFDDVDDIRIAPLSSDAGPWAARAQLDANFVNADGNAGINMRIRSHSTADSFQSSLQNGVHFHFASGWVSLAENMVTVHGGFVNNGFFNAQDRMFEDDSGEGLGVLAFVRPMDGLTLGFGAFSQGVDGLSLMGEDDEGDFTAQARGTFSVRYEMPDFLRVTFGLRNANEMLGGTGNHGGFGTPGRGQNSQAYLSVAYLADPDMHAAFTARFMALEEFSDFGDMRFYATFGHTGLVDNMGLHLGASLGMSQAENSDMHLWIWAGVDYALNEGRIVPRLDLHYVMGGRWDAWQSISHFMVRDAVTFNENDSFIHIRPSVQFRITPATHLELGGIFHIDLSDDEVDSAANPGSWGSGRPHGLNMGAYALVRVQF